MRFKITDNRSGEQYNVSETNRQAIVNRPLLKSKQLKHHIQEKDADETLTQEEIVGLKKLAKLSSKLETLIEKLEDKDEDDKEETDEEEKEEIEEETEEEIESENDEIDIDEIEEDKVEKDDNFDDLDADDDAEEVEDEEEIVENDESIDDTDEVIFDKKRKCDSKKSFGALEKTTKDSLNDKEIDEQNEIAEAWKLRYKGGR